MSCILLKTVIRGRSMLRPAGCREILFWRIVSVPPIRRSSNKQSGESLLCKIQLPRRSNDIAVIDSGGSYSYGSILDRSLFMASDIIRRSGAGQASTTESGSRNVAFLCPNDHTYLVTLLAIWLSGNTAVPLCRSYPAEQLGYYIGDCRAALLIATATDQDQERTVLELGARYNVPTLIQQDPGQELPELNRCSLSDSGSPTVKLDSPALVLYTSGTTGSPKGVVLSHGNLTAQTDALVAAWRFSPSDTNLHALPLHHLHGVMGALLTPLSAGAAVYMLPKFDSAMVWNHLTARDSGMQRINTYMAVPTMYSKLLEDYDKRYADNPAAKEFILAMCKEKIRLMVSGSAALSESVFERWEQVTGHTLLERYGMTEIGLVLSNPLQGPRAKGMVGTPVPGVAVCIAHPNAYSAVGYDLLAHADSIHGLTLDVGSTANSSGELYVRGPTVFRDYWERPHESRKSFTADGWFKTGDIATTVDGSFKILGRASVDIIKSGGYKISALDVESRLLQHPLLVECCVVGLADVTWGQKVAALVVSQVKECVGDGVNPSPPLTPMALRDWCKTVMPPHSVPSVITFVDAIPRNAMGKVNKKELVQQYFS